MLIMQHVERAFLPLFLKGGVNHHNLNKVMPKSSTRAMTSCYHLKKVNRRAGSFHSMITQLKKYNFGMLISYHEVFCHDLNTRIK